MVFPAFDLTLPATGSVGPASAPARELLVLVSDAFGGVGGIAKFNRDLLRALCLHPGVTNVTVLPRVISDTTGRLPSRLVYDAAAARGKAAYVYSLLKLLRKQDGFGGVICGH